jgi:uncharacterized protein YoxC
MASDVTREEFKHLAVRVDVLEREVEGEKLVTRHILEQTRRNSDDLAAIKTRLDRVERKVDGLDEKFVALDSKVDRLDQKVDGWTWSLPTMIGEVMREVMRERDKS